MKLQVLPPDVNVSDKDFTPVYVERRDEETKRRRDGVKGTPKSSSTSSLRLSVSPSLSTGVIRFGMCAVRGVGEKAVENIIAVRGDKGSFKTLYEFCERVDLRTVQKSTIEALVKCGAFASIWEKRAPLLHVLDRAFDQGQQMQNDKRSGQFGLFNAESPLALSRMETAPATLPDVPELPNADLLKFEKELLGFYITSHPLMQHQQLIEQFTTATTRDIQHLAEGREITLGGMISRVKKTVVKNGRSAGQPMAILTIEDLEGQVDATIFSDTYAGIVERDPGLVAAESIVFVRGKVDRRRETPGILISEVVAVDQSIPRFTTAIAFCVDRGKHDEAKLQELKPLLEKHKGKLSTFLQVASNDSNRVIVRLNKEFQVRASRPLIDEAEQVLGAGGVKIIGEGNMRLRRIEQQKLFGEDTSVTTTQDAPMEMVDDE
jgi:DNA polymerase-3 subunit alpha